MRGDIQRIRELYDSFEVKDMSWLEFLAEFQATTDPAAIQRDLAGIMTGKQIARSNAAKIDGAIGRIDRPD